MQVNIRIRDDLYNELRETAKKNHRTITAELEVILLNALEVREKVITKNSIESSNNYNSNSIETPKKKPRTVIGGTEEEFLEAKTKGKVAPPNPITPFSKPNASTPTVDEFIKFLDDEDISPDDTSWDLFDGIKKQVYKKLDINVFDEAQTIRKNRRK